MERSWALYPVMLEWTRAYLVVLQWWRRVGDAVLELVDLVCAGPLPGLCCVRAWTFPIQKPFEFLPVFTLSAGVQEEIKPAERLPRLLVSESMISVLSSCHLWFPPWVLLTVVFITCWNQRPTGWWNGITLLDKAAICQLYEQIWFFESKGPWLS